MRGRLAAERIGVRRGELAESTQPLVALAGVRKSFDDNLVIDGIDLEVERGEAPSVVAGPSGSGKSTMLRCINGLEPIDAGTISFDGPRVRSDGREIYAIRAEIGMVFQQFNLFPHMTVIENITLGPLEVGEGSSSDDGPRAGAAAARAGRDPRQGRRLPGRPLRAASSSGSRSPERSRSSRS